jgi:hypothetical protein
MVGRHWILCQGQMSPESLAAPLITQDVAVFTGHLGAK